MPASPIRVVIEGPAGAGRPRGAVMSGERVTGRVAIRAEAAWGEAPLRVEVVRVVRGRHGESRTVTASEIVRQGPWPDGAVEVPFAIEAPDGVPSSRGRLFDVDWWVEARVDRAAPRPDLVGAAKIALRPAAGSEAVPVAAAGLQRPQSGGAGAGATLLVGAAPGLALLVAAFVVHGGLASGAGRLHVLFGLAVLALGLGLAWLFGRNNFAQHRLGEVRAEVSPQDATPGGKIAIKLGFSAQREVTVSRIVARLEATEHLSVGRAAMAEEVLLHEQVLLANRQVARGEAVEVEDAIALPADAPTTVTLPDARRTWRLALQIEIPAWPDWVATAPLTVRLPALPAIAAAEAEAPSRQAGESAELLALAERLKAVAHDEAARAAALARASADPVQLRLRIEAIEWTCGLDPDPLARGGRTLVARLGDGEARVGVRFPAPRNDELDAMRPGELVSVVGRPVAYNALLDRLELDANPHEPALRLGL